MGSGAAAGELVGCLGATHDHAQQGMGGRGEGAFARTGCSRIRKPGLHHDAPPMHQATSGGHVVHGSVSRKPHGGQAGLTWLLSDDSQRVQGCLALATNAAVGGWRLEGGVAGTRRGEGCTCQSDFFPRWRLALVVRAERPLRRLPGRPSRTSPCTMKVHTAARGSEVGRSVTAK